MITYLIKDDFQEIFFTCLIERYEARLLEVDKRQFISLRL